jgi:hypothetical protein
MAELESTPMGRILRARYKAGARTLESIKSALTDGKITQAEFDFVTGE